MSDLHKLILENCKPLMEKSYGDTITETEFYKTSNGHNCSGGLAHMFPKFLKQVLVSKNNTLRL